MQIGYTMLWPKLSRSILVSVFLLSILACAGGSEVIKVTTVGESSKGVLGEQELAHLEEIKAAHQDEDDPSLQSVIEETPNYTVSEYLSLYPRHGASQAADYRVGPYDVLDIKIYEEPDLSRENVSVSGKGYISFPLIGRLEVGGRTTTEIERLIYEKLVQGNLLLDAHVAVDVREYNSKKFMVLGAVNGAGTYSLKAQETVLDAISRSGGIDFEQGGKEAMIIRTLNSDDGEEKRIVIRIDLLSLLKGGDQFSNLLLVDKDLFYVPKADFYYLIGQIKSPGKYPYREKEITLLEAISAAGGFTLLASRNKTRIIRVVDGVEKVIEVRIDAITKSGKRNQDIKILPNDVIVVPERFF
jgi:polysaccharide export outer membrane protein